MSTNTTTSTDEPPHNCADCPESFDSMDDLVDHRTDAHDAYTRAT